MAYVGRTLTNVEGVTRLILAEGIDDPQDGSPAEPTISFDGTSFTRLRDMTNPQTGDEERNASLTWTLN